MNNTYRAIAALLDYPSDELLQHLEEVGDALDPRSRQSVAALLSQLDGADLLDAQEAYIETFDRGRRTALNLFEHVHGDSRDRGQAMVDLQAMYANAGLGFDSEQLPDYLPAFLEYLSLLPDAEARAQLAEVAHILQAIGAALLRRASPYAGLFEALLGNLGQRIQDKPEIEDDTTPEAIDAAWRDAPVEFLGSQAPCTAGAASRSEQPISFQRRGA